MVKNCDKIENLMIKHNCTGDRVTKELIESRIKNVEHQIISICGTKFMYCGIKMDNDFVVVGKPATCIDEANWRDEIGMEISYDNAFDEIWRLEAYRKLSGC